MQIDAHVLVLVPRPFHVVLHQVDARIALHRKHAGDHGRRDGLRMVGDPSHVGDLRSVM